MSKFKEYLEGNKESSEELQYRVHKNKIFESIDEMLNDPKMKKLKEKLISKRTIKDSDMIIMTFFRRIEQIKKDLL